MADPAALSGILTSGRRKDLGLFVRRRTTIQLSHLRVLCHDIVSIIHFLIQIYMR